MQPKFVLGIDAGGSKTLAMAAAMDGQVLGRGRSGPGNFRVVGQEAARRALEEAAGLALGNAGIDAGAVAALCLGAAGVGAGQDRSLVDRPVDERPVELRPFWLDWAAGQFPGARLRVVNDALIVLAAGMPGGAQDCCGLAVIAGTGSIVYGRDTKGNLLRAGGWGYLLGDEGSNYAIGLAALCAITRAADGRGPLTALTGLVLTHWGLDDPTQLIDKVYSDLPRKDIARLGKQVEAAAAQGDAVADAILVEAGRELAAAVHAVYRRLGLEGETPVALAGSVLLRGPRVREVFLRAAQEAGMDLNPVGLVEEPALGAVRIAIDMLEQEGF